MTRREVVLFKSIQDVLDLIAKAGPSNPADTAALFAIGATAPVACRHLYWAIFHIGIKDWDRAQEFIRLAREEAARQRQILSEARTRHPVPPGQPAPAS